MPGAVDSLGLVTGSTELAALFLILMSEINMNKVVVPLDTCKGVEENQIANEL